MRAVLHGVDIVLALSWASATAAATAPALALPSLTSLTPLSLASILAPRNNTIDKLCTLKRSVFISIECCEFVGHAL